MQGQPLTGPDGLAGLGSRLGSLSVWRVSDPFRDYARVAFCCLIEMRCEYPEAIWRPSALRTASRVKQVSRVSCQEHLSLLGNHCQDMSHQTHTHTPALGTVPPALGEAPPRPPGASGHSLFPFSLFWVRCEPGLGRTGVHPGWLEKATVATLGSRAWPPETGGQQVTQQAVPGALQEKGALSEVCGSLRGREGGPSHFTRPVGYR